jgi:hypothetical protein
MGPRKSRCDIPSGPPKDVFAQFNNSWEKCSSWIVDEKNISTNTIN